MKKLTLTAEPDVIEKAKKLAKARGISVSSMFSQLIRTMGNRSKGTIPLGPITRRLTGIARAPRGKTDRQLLEEALLHRET